MLPMFSRGRQWNSLIWFGKIYTLLLVLKISTQLLTLSELHSQMFFQKLEEYSLFKIQRISILSTAGKCKKEPEKTHLFMSEIKYSPCPVSI